MGVNFRAIQALLGVDADGRKILTTQEQQMLLSSLITGVFECNEGDGLKHNELLKACELLLKTQGALTHTQKIEHSGLINHQQLSDAEAKEYYLQLQKEAESEF